ncbi:hypothetical protein GA0070560_105176 [Micromonospora halophytica]|uniref:Uncharacterized protein n=1 Tax=Micromonospora halophytica TaxID=47864 RepID=A0A1C5HPH0_9ACTN|nr:hypothetical protein GA0070560_105176 [Micromonospora halophytica]
MAEQGGGGRVGIGGPQTGHSERDVRHSVVGGFENEPRPRRRVRRRRGPVSRGTSVAPPPGRSAPAVRRPTRVADCDKLWEQRRQADRAGRRRQHIGRGVTPDDLSVGASTLCGGRSTGPPAGRDSRRQSTGSPTSTAPPRVTSTDRRDARPGGRSGRRRPSWSPLLSADCAAVAGRRARGLLQGATLPRGRRRGRWAARRAGSGPQMCRGSGNGQGGVGGRLSRTGSEPSTSVSRETAPPGNARSWQRVSRETTPGLATPV